MNKDDVFVDEELDVDECESLTSEEIDTVRKMIAVFEVFAESFGITL